jgi:ferric-dicitrate binding protein FerR (iron transport regulator)
LGTHFNINAYDNEAAVKTTLLEGRVKVSSMVNGEWSILNPGEQAVGKANSPLTIDHSPNLEQVMAWKNGSFNFNDADITTIMRQLERWYNIQVVYEGNKPTYLFAGGMPRTATLMEVLQILQVSKVHFKLEGRKLTVLP